MRKLSKAPKITRKCLTEEVDTFYPQHLMFRKRKLFPQYNGNPQQTSNEKKQAFNQETNFGFSITHPYVFVLLHLRSKNNKNVLNINIPQVCIFVNQMPYDILYSQDGFIRGFKSQDSMKCRMRDCQIKFKEVWKIKNQPKNQHVSAVFKQKQVLIMSQTDFIIVCKKIKSDPFFKKLEYIQNKLQFIGQQIVTEYDSTNKDQQLLKLATESLFGFKDEKELMNELGEERYLSFMNEKITLVLNYQHNVRVNKANFHYVKNQNSEYYLVNVTNLQFVNLTKALKIREKKLKQLQQEKQKLLILTPQRQRKYRSYQNPKEIIKIETLMKQNFQGIVKKMNFLSISQSRNQEIKNQQAFRRLHPEIKQDYRQLVSMTDFKRTREKLFGSTISGRKPISIPSKYVLRTYNKSKRSYTICKTEQLSP